MLFTSEKERVGFQSDLALVALYTNNILNVC